MSTLPVQPFASHSASLTPSVHAPCADCNRLYVHTLDCPRSNGDPNTPVGRDDARLSGDPELDPDPEPGNPIILASAEHRAEVRRFDAWCAARTAAPVDADIAPADDPEPVGPDPEDAAWHASLIGEWDVPAPAEPRLPFAEAIAVEASIYRSKGTSFGDWLASKLDGLAEDARYFEASTPAEFEARQDAHTDWLALAAEGGAR